MQLSKQGIELIKKHEGLSVFPYLCPAKVPTIGYGATYYLDGTPVSMKDEAISEPEAEDLLEKMVARYAEGVNRYVQSSINQNQFDAIVSFAYNLGLGALKSSTLLRRINNNPCDPDIAYQFSRWNKAGGEVLRGLTKRRKEEAELYFR
jgi:lysozyme